MQYLVVCMDTETGYLFPLSEMYKDEWMCTPIHGTHAMLARCMYWLIFLLIYNSPLRIIHATFKWMFQYDFKGP